MEAFDVDEVIAVEFPETTDGNEPQSVEVVFKDGRRRIFSDPDLPAVLETLRHWTPPTA